MTKSIYTVYQVQNLTNNKIYIGVHKTTNPNDKYFGSGFHIKRAIKKYGKQSFIKSILFEYDNPEDAFLKESQIVDPLFVERKDTYNLICGGTGSSKKHNNILSINHKHKISQSMIGQKRALGSKHTPIIKLNNALRSTGGIIKTPFNEYYPSFKIAIDNGCPNSLRKYINTNKIITKNIYNRTEYFKNNFYYDIIGKNWNNIGFSLIELKHINENHIKQMAKYYS